MSSRSASPALVDARWIGIGGPGARRRASAAGTARARARRASGWCGAPTRSTRISGRARRGSRTAITRRRSTASASFRARGRRTARVAYYAHHLRPGVEARAGRGHDGARHDPVPVPAVARARAADARSTSRGWRATRRSVVTDSEFSKQSLQEDLGLDPDRIVVLTLAIDHDAADARAARCAPTTPRAERVMFVGRDAPHKNLDRLVTGFAASDFAANGAVLTLAGVDGPAVERLRNARGAAPGARRAARASCRNPSSSSCSRRRRCSCSRRSKRASACRSRRRWRPGIPVAISTAPALAGDHPGRARRGVRSARRRRDRARDRSGRGRAAVGARSSSGPGPVDFARSVLAAMDRAETLHPGK